MKKIILGLLFICLIHYKGYGQDNERNRGLSLGMDYRYLAFTNGEMEMDYGYNGSLYANANGMSLRAYIGYYFTQNINLNLGFGLDRYNNPGSNTAPLVFQAKYIFAKKLTGFYVFAEGGPLFDLSPAGSMDQGQTYGSGIGKTFKLSRILKLSTSVGYCYQTSSNKYFGEEFRRNSMIFGIGLFY
jgi:hypothetical protein